MTFYEKYKGGEYSQNGEHGILTECLNRIGLTFGTAIEFGAPTKQYCSNIYELPDMLFNMDEAGFGSGAGWLKLYYDIDPKEEGIIKMEVTPENVNELPTCFVLSIDVDGNDYNIWQAYEGKPDIVIIEINSSLSPTDMHWSIDHGSSFATMNYLAEEKGYFLLCHTGNCVYLLSKYKELFPDADGTFKADWL